jgi:hypothetical protein
MRVLGITSASWMQSQRDAGRIPKLCRQTFEAAIVERCRCRESSVEQTWDWDVHSGDISIDVTLASS